LLAARAVGRERAIVPAGNLSEAALTTGMTVWGVAGLGNLIASLQGAAEALIPGVTPRRVVERSGPDLADVLGQPEARLALEFAAAGGHHLAMIGPPAGHHGWSYPWAPTLPEYPAPAGRPLLEKVIRVPVFSKIDGTSASTTAVVRDHGASDLRR